MDKVESLIKEYGYWGEHPQLKLSEWQWEVSEDYTRSSYWAWVAALMDEEDTMEIEQE